MEKFNFACNDKNNEFNEAASSFFFSKSRCFSHENIIEDRFLIKKK